MNEAIKEYTEIINTDPERHRADFDKQIEYIKNSTAKYHGRVVRTLAIPKIFNSKIVSDFKNIAEVSHRILTKVINEYLTVPKFREQFLFEKQLEDFILTDAEYEGLLPVAIVDIFYIPVNNQCPQSTI